MEHFELVEKLVNTFGVSYEEAKIALEKCGWDPVEAAVYLERVKNGEPIPEEPKAEEPQPEVNTGRKGSARVPQYDWKEEGSKFINTVWNFLNLNEFVVKKSSGEVFMNIPIWIAVLLICAFFWPVAIIMLIVFIMGYRFSIRGPQFGGSQKKGPRGSAEPIHEDVVEDVVEEVVNPCPEATEEPAAEPQPETPVQETSPETGSSEPKEE